jgi:hypothetical protein
MESVEVVRGRTITLPVTLTTDLTDYENIRSQIRVERDPESEEIAAWNVATVPEVSVYDLVLRLDNAITTGITQTMGYMDIVGDLDGEPTTLLRTIKVDFVNAPTV